jgi:ABC-type microcin C transport system duplicated ATPase subunit YejF
LTIYFIATILVSREIAVRRLKIGILFNTHELCVASQIGYRVTRRGEFVEERPIGNLTSRDEYPRALQRRRAEALRSLPA